MKKELKVVEDEEESLDSQKKLRRFVQRFCLMSLAKHERDFREENVLESLGQHYEGGVKRVVADNPQIMEDLELLKVEKDLSGVRRTKLDTPHDAILKDKGSFKKRAGLQLFKFLRGLFPPLEWFPEYLNMWKDNIKGDIIAGSKSYSNLDFFLFLHQF